MPAGTGPRKQDPTTESKQVTCVQPCDESKILACHRKQAIGVCMPGPSTKARSFPPPSEVEACKRI